MVDAASPMLSCECHYSTPRARRTFLVHPPIRDGPLAANQLVQLKSISAEMMELLSSAVKPASSIVISGGTGARQNHLHQHPVSVLPNQRAARHHRGRPPNSRLAQENIVRLETRPPNIEGQVQFASANCSSIASVCAPTASSMGEVPVKKPSICLMSQ